MGFTFFHAETDQKSSSISSSISSSSSSRSSSISSSSSSRSSSMSSSSSSRSSSASISSSSASRSSISSAIATFCIATAGNNVSASVATIIFSQSVIPGNLSYQDRTPV
ncbi:MAG: hypothetical protein CML99_13235 [Rhodobiaceae bacterium]|nr:hypothetical protein [Rhodobiaceae bacterium]